MNQNTDGWSEHSVRDALLYYLLLRFSTEATNSHFKTFEMIIEADIMHMPSCQPSRILEHKIQPLNLEERS